MKIPRLTIRRLMVALAAIAFVQAVSSTLQRYLSCQGKAGDCLLSEGVFRRRAGVCQELSPNLRELAALARELARSSSSDFERSRWLEMAHSGEEKATRGDREAVHLTILADQMATQANAYHQAAWRPWLAEPD